MTRERLYLFDTTLRDGQQTPGVDFSVEDKIAIAGMLDEFGMDYVEGGYPGANPTDTAFFDRKRLRESTPLCPAGHLPLKGGDQSLSRPTPIKSMSPLYLNE